MTSLYGWKRTGCSIGSTHDAPVKVVPKRRPKHQKPKEEETQHEEEKREALEAEADGQEPGETFFGRFDK